MPRIIYIEHDGTEHVVDAESGKSVMQTAVDNLVPGIIGDCGGCCSCATCHGYIDDIWLQKLPAAPADERLMLDGAVDIGPGSRLTCQVEVTEELDGMIVRLPKSQL